MEELLNKLIGKGYKPFGITTKILHIGRTPNNYIYFDGGFGAEHCYSFRDLVSKGSGLWKFVCKNGMIKNPNIERYWKNYFELDHIEYYQSDFQYWLLESSLKDESELEDFLLSNIKVDAND